MDICTSWQKGSIRNQLLSFVRQKIIDECFSIRFVLGRFHNGSRTWTDDRSFLRIYDINRLTFSLCFISHVIHRCCNDTFGSCNNRIKRLLVCASHRYTVAFVRFEERPAAISLSAQVSGHKIKSRAGKRRVRNIHLIFKFRLG
ncbi:hypothetical protein D3C74_361990 [compost metagenome]